MSAINSKIVRYIQSKGWNFQVTDTQVKVEICPISGCTGWHWFASYEPEKDGVWNCFKCSSSGNLYQLMEFLGDRMNNVLSINDVASAGRERDPLPNVDDLHRKLIAEGNDPEADNTTLDYLVSERGFKMEVIEKYKLGLMYEYGKKWISIPHFTNDRVTYVKFRTAPPEKKDFLGTKGYEMALYNGDCLAPNMDELLMVEGEFDTLACISKGIEKVVGLPGANVKKRTWVQRIDEIAPKKIYLLYDSDKVGQAAAKEMAKAIGIDKVLNIVLPEFTFTTPDGTEKQGKDINDFFKSGRTVADLEELKQSAKHFSVDGVQPVGEVVDKIRRRLMHGETLRPRWVTEWESLNRKIGGFAEGDLVGIMAEAKCGKTSMAMNILDFLNRTYYEPAMMYCQEMQPERLVTKWMAYVTDTAEDQITLETTDIALRIASERRADYLFAYTRTTSRKEVFDTIRQAVRRYGVKFVCFDNLQMLCRNIEHSAQEANVISKEFKALAMELGIVIFLIVQPHRVREGEIVSARNAFGTSAIEKDVDIMLCLHRNREGKVKGEDFAAMGYMEVDENFAPEMLVRADLTRYASGGATTLRMIGEKSKVTEFTMAEREDKNRLLPVNEVLNQTVATYEAA